MANLLKNGDIGRHLKKANKLYHERRDMLCHLLRTQLSEYISFRVPDGGFASLNAKEMESAVAIFGKAIKKVNGK
ncbi:MAG TPA: hypothetical protein VNS58_00255 [Puia sp.]|nr:hypothetical protein [Puia sp.]